MPSRPWALNVNVDSLASSTRFLDGVAAVRPSSDPTYGPVADRFLAIADELRLRLTFFVVGRDLRDPAIGRTVRAWSEAGHEIGNHSLDHIQNLGELQLEAIREQVRTSHELIGDAIGRAPRGFVSPGWSMSAALVEILLELGYDYDSSLFPSPLMPLVQLRLRRQATGAARTGVPVLRTDLPGSLFGSRRPYFATSGSPWRGSRRGPPAIIELPLPTTRWRQPVWHTMAFLLPPLVQRFALSDALRNTRAFYYLMHPNDLLDPDADLEGLPGGLRRLERVAVPLTRKTHLLRVSLTQIMEGRTSVTMAALADGALAELDE